MGEKINKWCINVLSSDNYFQTVTDNRDRGSTNYVFLSCALQDFHSSKTKK